MVDLRHKAEMIHSKSPFRLLFIDHISLLSPRKWVASRTDRDNELIRDAKKLAGSFNRGEGMAVVALFQISRDGYKMALKAKEKAGTPRYDLTALSYSNECERSADIVTTSWIDDDLRASNRVQFQCLKSRDQKPFDIFLCRIEWITRRMLTCFDFITPQDHHNAVVENELNDKLIDG